MKIELKNIKHSPSLSEETAAFTANLYINGIHAGFASNHGHGGPTGYDAANEQGRKLIMEAETHCKALPPSKFTLDGEECSIDMDLEGFIDDLLIDYLEQREILKFRQKIEKATLSGIAYGVPDHSYRVKPYKVSIAKILTFQDGAQLLAESIEHYVKPKLKKGEMVLNINIPETILKAAKLSDKQYVKPAEKPIQKQKQKPGKKAQRRL